ncbi:hypothetical protein Tco_0667053 [Tanacetum coccineum]
MVKKSNHEDNHPYTGTVHQTTTRSDPQTSAISNNKAPNRKKRRNSAMETSKKRISIEKDVLFEYFQLVTAAEIQLLKKERKAKNILLNWPLGS